jgi:AraC-like DNA-binding protein
VNIESPTALQAFQRAYARRKDNGFEHSGADVLDLGCETRTDPAAYIWDGMRRGGDPRHPRILVQFTLEGCGRFEQGKRAYKVGPETAFFTVIPSRHVYRLPEDNPHWSFFWLNIGHPWVVQRITALIKTHAPVIPIASGSKLMATSRSFFEQVCYRRLPDAFAEEAVMLDWMLEFERHLHNLAHPQGPRDSMIRQLRAFTLANLSRSFGIEEFARQQGISRSHCGHLFKQITGLSPAAHVLEIRMTEARRRLRETNRPLKDIAAETGFADANHFCKAFRRHCHLSPGAYRKQAG